MTVIGIYVATAMRASTDLMNGYSTSRPEYARLVGQLVTAVAHRATLHRPLTTHSHLTSRTAPISWQSHMLKVRWLWWWWFISSILTSPAFSAVGLIICLKIFCFPLIFVAGSWEARWLSNSGWNLLCFTRQTCPTICSSLYCALLKQRLKWVFGRTWDIF